MWYLVIPVASFIGFFAIYPLTMLVSLLRVRTSQAHAMPYTERNCHVAFIRENMLLATVLDSFCINNYVYICSKPLVFGKIMGAWTFFCQDLPQTVIHLYFLWYVHDRVPHSDLTVKTSLCISCAAVCVSFFNFIMCQPNDFDPIQLMIELKRRQLRSLEVEELKLKQRSNSVRKL